MRAKRPSIRINVLAAISIPIMLAPAAASCQVPMTKAEARRILMQHIQAPDKVLTDTVKVDIKVDGHPEYRFEGDKGGRYRIDAVCGSKWIDYKRVSKLEIWDKTENKLPPDKLVQIAKNYVSAHFSSYDPGMFTIESWPCDGGTYILYEVKFTSTSGSGAVLPSKVSVELEEDTGALSRYEEVNNPVKVSMIPAITQDQAVAHGRAWIARNISANPSKGELPTPAEQYPVLLKVDVNAFINQTLVYTIYFRRSHLTIDAQSGLVLLESLYASSDEDPGGVKYKPVIPEERLWEVRWPNNSTLTHSAIATQAGVFIWGRYAENIGVKIRKDRGKVVLSCKGNAARIPIASSRPVSQAETWLRHGELYLPVEAVLQLTNRIGVDSERQAVTLVPLYMKPGAAARD